MFACFALPVFAGPWKRQFGFGVCRCLVILSPCYASSHRGEVSIGQMLDGLGSDDRRVQIGPIKDVAWESGGGRGIALHLVEVRTCYELKMSDEFSKLRKETKTKKCNLSPIRLEL